MDVEWSKSERYLPGETRCVITNWADVDELLDLRTELRSQIPGAQPLFVIDDAGQASYTRGHRTQDVGFIGEEDHHEFSAIMVRWLEGENAQDTFEFDEPLIPIDDASIDLLGHLDDPDRVFVDPLHCWVVESPDPSMAIAAFPNGYFLGDLSPAQNYLLAEKLRQTHGLKLFGLGARFAAFCRADPISADEAKQVVGAVRHMYAEMTDELAAQWAEKTAGRRWFLVSYRRA